MTRSGARTRAPRAGRSRASRARDASPPGRSCVRFLMDARLGPRVALGLLLALGSSLPARAQEEGHTATPGQIEGRPLAGDTSPLQARIDAARPGETVEVAASEYAGDLVIDKPLTLRGRGRPRLLGSGHGSVVRIRAQDVTVEGFDIDGRGGGDLSRDSSGVHVAGARATVRDCRIEKALFGVYLRAADDVTVTGCRIRGIPGKEPGEKGSGIHAWNTNGFRFEDNDIEDARDGFYIQSSSHGVVARNVARNLRYGLHYMFSDDNRFEDNTFENGAAGVALMYSKRIVFRRNRFLRNRGFASVGLLFKACDDVLAEDNLVADNARGIFLEGSYRNVFRRNVVAASDVAIVLYDSCGGNRFEGNSFVANLSPLQLVGRRTDTVFLGNYYSDADSPDLDGDGRADLPYRLSSVFDHLRGNLTAADLMAQGLAASALGAAEKAFPVLEPVLVTDSSPLARPPALPNVPETPKAERGRNAAGLLASLAALGTATGLLRAGLRPLGSHE
jgi:nitrous oxidase accessory protein